MSPLSILQDQAPPGFRLRRREALPGKTLRETDKLVRAVGGWREGGCYVLTDSALDSLRAMSRHGRFRWLARAKQHLCNGRPRLRER
jgi:hypothetical protein